MRYQKWASLGLLLVLCALSLTPYPTTVAEAQSGGTLSYGSSVVGTIAPDVPLVLYSFTGTQGDLVRIDTLGLNGGLEPVVDLIGPDRQVLTSSKADSLASSITDARIALYLPASGAYSLMVGGANGTTGQYALQLAGRGMVIATPLVYGVEQPVSIVQNTAPQYFTFNAEACPTTLVVSDIAPAEPYTTPFIVKVRDSQARTVAILRGGETVEDRVTVEPLSGTYEVEVWTDDPAQTGSLALLVTCADQVPACLPNDYGMEAGAAAACPECPPCDGLDEDEALCGAFVISVDAVDGGVITFSWPLVEGAEGVIYAITTEGGDLIASRMMENFMGTSDTVDLGALGGGSGVYTIHAYAWTEADGYICEDATTVTVEGLGPVDWGPAVDECTIAVVAPLGTMANGLQTFFWTVVPGAESYRLRIYGQFDSVVADGAISAPATSMTLDVSEASIGVGYGGGNEFYIQVDAYRGGDRWCANGVRVTRSP